LTNLTFVVDSDPRTALAHEVSDADTNHPGADDYVMFLVRHRDLFLEAVQAVVITTHNSQLTP
jgi:hypothetical protein